MGRSVADNSIQRVTEGGFAFPLGVYPVEPIEPVPGFRCVFEPADGGAAPGDLEEWPDRYAFEIVVPADRLRAMCRTIFELLPPRVFPILDVLGNDAYREVDPYIAYEPVGLDRFLDAVRRHGDWLYEDGLVGFGAMCDEPFVYAYLDEHKTVTVRAEGELKEEIERTLAAFDLKETPAPRNVDAASHEHRSVLMCPPDQPELMTAEEIVEDLQDEWRLTLNVDRDGNVDDRGRPLGITPWRCLLRATPEDENEPERYGEALLTAGSMGAAEGLALEAAQTASDAAADHVVVLFADRLTPAQAESMFGAPPPPTDSEQVRSMRWLD